MILKVHRHHGTGLVIWCILSPFNVLRLCSNVLVSESQLMCPKLLSLMFTTEKEDIPFKIKLWDSIKLPLAREYFSFGTCEHPTTLFQLVGATSFFRIFFKICRRIVSAFLLTLIQIVTVLLHLRHLYVSPLHRVVAQIHWHVRCCHTLIVTLLFQHSTMCTSFMIRCC